MPWFAWIAVVAIIVYGGAQLVSMLTGRPLPRRREAPEEVEELRRRLETLEQQASSGELEAPTTPSRAEENLAAEDRWRLDMLETRLERLERGPDQS